MTEDSRDTERATPSVRRRTVVGTLAAGAGLAALGSTAQAQEDGGIEADHPDWYPDEASEAHAAALSGNQADVETNAGGCAHVTPLEEENSLLVDLVLEDIQCVTQAHIHAGERGEDGPIVAPLLQYTAQPDGSGDGDPLTTEPDTPLIAGAVVDDADVVAALLANPEDYYVNVHTVHNPAGEIRGQIRGYSLGQETDIEPEPAEFTVSSLRPQDATVVQGDSVDVSAKIYNDGDVAASQTVELRIDGSTIGEQSVELGCRRSTKVTFEDVDTSDLDPDDYEHGIFTEDDSATGSLTVLSPPDFQVSNLDPRDATVTQGDLLTVAATVENVGQASGTQTIELRLDGETIADQRLELDGGESESVSFEDVDTSDLDPGEYEHGVFSEDDSQTGSLTVQSPPDFQVSDLEPQDVTVTQGDVIDVSATVENVGQATGTQTVQFRVDDDALADQELELEGGASQSVTFEDIDTAPLEPGDYEHGVFTANDSETATLTVEAGDGGETPTETPGTEEPPTETPGTETPGTETPGTETPGTETPGTETPETGTPTEEPGTDVPTPDENGA